MLRSRNRSLPDRDRSLRGNVQALPAIPLQSPGRDLADRVKSTCEPPSFHIPAEAAHQKTIFIPSSTCLPVVMFCRKAWPNVELVITRSGLARFNRLVRL